MAAGALPSRDYVPPPTRASMRRDPIEDFEATVPRAPRQHRSRNPSARVPPPSYEPRESQRSPRGTMLVVEQQTASGRSRRLSDEPPSPRSGVRSTDYIDFTASPRRDQSSRRERSTASSVRSHGSHNRRRGSDGSGTIRSRSGSQESGLSASAGVSSPGRRSSRTLEVSGSSSDPPTAATSPALSSGSIGSRRKGRVTGSEGQLFGPSVLESSRSSRTVRKRASMVPEDDEAVESAEKVAPVTGLQLDIPARPVATTEPELSPVPTIRASPSPPVVPEAESSPRVEKRKSSPAVEKRKSPPPVESDVPRSPRVEKRKSPPSSEARQSPSLKDATDVPRSPRVEKRKAPAPAEIVESSPPVEARSLPPVAVARSPPKLPLKSAMRAGPSR